MPHLAVLTQAATQIQNNGHPVSRLTSSPHSLLKQNKSFLDTFYSMKQHLVTLDIAADKRNAWFLRLRLLINVVILMNEHEAGRHGCRRPLCCLFIYSPEGRNGATVISHKHKHSQ